MPCLFYLFYFIHFLAILLFLPRNTVPACMIRCYRSVTSEEQKGWAEKGSLPGAAGETQAGSVSGLLDIVLAPTPQFQAGLGSGAGFPWSLGGGGTDSRTQQHTHLGCGTGDYGGSYYGVSWWLARCNLGFRREGDFVSLLLLSTPAPRYLRGVQRAPLTVARQGSLLCRYLVLLVVPSGLLARHARTRTSAQRASAVLVGFEIHGGGQRPAS